MAYYFSSVLFNCTEHAEMLLISSFPAAVPFEGGIYFFFYYKERIYVYEK